MFAMALHSAKLFVAGKLLKDNRMVVRQLALGAGAGVIAGLVAGFAQPILLKDVKSA